MEYEKAKREVKKYKKEIDCKIKNAYKKVEKETKEAKKLM